MKVTVQASKINTEWNVNEFPAESKIYISEPQDWARQPRQLTGWIETAIYLGTFQRQPRHCFSQAWYISHEATASSRTPENIRSGSRGNRRSSSAQYHGHQMQSLHSHLLQYQNITMNNKQNSLCINRIMVII
jgi:hypothetical protein